MKLYLILITIVFSRFSFAADYDCSQFKPFAPIDTLKADITVYRLHKFISDGQSEEVEEEICTSSKPVVVLLKDIRGREADWYYCDKPSAENFISCDTEYKNKPAKIYIKPAMLIRTWKPSDALDTHMHVNLLPENDESRILDNFTQSLGFELSQRNITLNGSSGGRGPKSDQDYFYVRTRIYK